MMCEERVYCRTKSKKRERKRKINVVGRETAQNEIEETRMEKKKFCDKERERVCKTKWKKQERSKKKKTNQCCGVRQSVEQNGRNKKGKDKSIQLERECTTKQKKREMKRKINVVWRERVQDKMEKEKIN